MTQKVICCSEFKGKSQIIYIYSYRYIKYNGGTFLVLDGEKLRYKGQYEILIIVAMSNIWNASMLLCIIIG